MMEKLPNEADHKLHYLHVFLNALPSSLPKPQHGKLPRFPFKTFHIDSCDVEDLEIVGAMNEGFKRIFGWQTKTTRDGILQITEHESDIGAVADVLKKLIKENPS
uniref:Uncharacterized protein n=1 Tax=Moniliophthora roreri TaxID=221103 RepID=A0A0W0F4E1_MONRR